MNIIEKLKIKLPPMPTAPPLHEPNRITLLQLGGLIGFAIITHFSIASPVIAGFALLVFLLKMAIIVRHGSAPPQIIMVVLTIFSLGMILFFYGGWNGQKAGISFLVLLVALKFLESKLLRDYYVVCLILYFLAASSFLFNSSPISIVSVLLYTIAITAILFKISNPSDMHWMRALKSSASIILKALPLAVLLFFFFPRIGGDFGFLPSQDERDGSNGLENSLVAGEMAAGAFDTSLAFRAEFETGIPPRQQLYWRSKVMAIERNFAWEVVKPFQRKSLEIDAKRDSANKSNDGSRYNILHEKSTDFYVPYLDYVSGYSKGQVLDDYSVFLKRLEPGSFFYSGRSTLRPTLASINIATAQFLRQADSVPTARMQALLTRWRNSTGSPQELVDAVLSHISANEFSYSLTPPSLDELNPIDDFIFDSRIGYCEHYASAFTIIMRWLDIPARVAVGYQGGQINQAGGYVEVRYSDAHAWSEVWIDGSWRRVDPTAAVSPERIEFGMEALVELWDGNSLASNASGRALANFLNPSGGEKLLRKLRDTWSNVGYRWNKWVVNYDKETQQELLSNLGLEHRNSLYTLVAIMGAGALAIMLFYFWQLVPRAIKRGAAQKAYLQFVRKFSKHKLEKQLADSPSDFAARACQSFPDSADDIQNITRAYEQLRYGRQPEDSATALMVFQQQVKRFKLKLSNN